MGHYDECYEEDERQDAKARLKRLEEHAKTRPPEENIQEKILKRLQAVERRARLEVPSEDLTNAEFDAEIRILKEW